MKLQSGLATGMLDSDEVCEVQRSISGRNRMNIRPAGAGDFESMWRIFKAAIATEDALP